MVQQRGYILIALSDTELKVVQLTSRIDWSEFSENFYRITTYWKHNAVIK